MERCKLGLPTCRNYAFKQGDTLKITVQVRDNDNNYSNLAQREFVYHL
jgi:hypothetical protein